MDKIFKVLQREYLTVVRKKSFLIITLLVPFLFAGFIAISIFSIQVKSEKQKRISVIDETGVIFDEFVSNLDDKLDNGEKKFILNKVEVGTNNPGEIDKKLRAMVTANKIDGFIYIKKDILEKMQVDYYARNATNFIENNRIRNALNSAVTKQKIINKGLDPSLVINLTRRIDFEVTRIVEGKKGQGGGQTYTIAFVLVFALYMSIATYGVVLGRSVVEEKDSKIVEILLSSLKPFHLMAGKILGTALVAFTQYLIWAVFGLLIFFSKNVFIRSSVNVPFNFPSIQPSLFVYFILFFILGYLIYAVIFAAIGAISGNESEARSYGIYIMMPLIFAFVFLQYIIGNPDTLLSIFLSLFPLTSPVIMLARICVSSISLIQIFASILVLILSIIGEIWIVAKIYRVGILMYGKKISMGEIVRWIRYS